MERREEKGNLIPTLRLYSFNDLLSLSMNYADVISASSHSR